MQVPYILSLTNPTGLSICIATMGLGTLTGGRLFGHFSRSLCAETTLLVGVGIESIAVACLGASSSVLVMSVCTLTMGATASFAAAANQTIWQRNVPYELQGRVISARSILAFSTPPLALLTAIPLQKKAYLSRGLVPVHLVSGFTVYGRVNPLGLCCRLWQPAFFYHYCQSATAWWIWAFGTQVPALPKSDLRVLCLSLLHYS